MSHTAVGTETYLAAHQALASILPAAGVPWLDHSRKSARDQFGEMGFPTTRDEQWKYTNVRSITRQLFALPPADSPSIDRTSVDDANRAGNGYVSLSVCRWNSGAATLPL